jgi:hypothetical protein
LARVNVNIPDFVALCLHFAMPNAAEVQRVLRSVRQIITPSRV